MEEAKNIVLTVDYNEPLKQVIINGKYYRVNRDITEENFPILAELIGQKIDISIRLFKNKRNMSSEAVIKKMKKVGFRPATLMELLALRSISPDINGNTSIIALGTIFKITPGRTSPEH